MMTKLLILFIIIALNVVPSAAKTRRTSFAEPASMPSMPGAPSLPGMSTGRKETYTDRLAQQEKLRNLLKDKQDVQQVVRDYLTNESKAKEKIEHSRILLAALRQFASNNDLPNQKPAPALPDAPKNDEQVDVLLDVLAYAEGYNIIYDMPNVADKSNPTSDERRAMYTVLDAVIGKLENVTIRTLIDRQTAPLRSALAEAMNLPRETYVDRAGIQRKAIPEVALKLSNEIEDIERTAQTHRIEITLLYRDKKVFDIVKRLNIDYPQAERSVDKWFERKIIEIAERQQAKERKNQFESRRRR